MIYTPAEIPKDLDERKRKLIEMNGRNIAVSVARNSYVAGRLIYDFVEDVFSFDGKPFEIDKLEELLILQE